MNHVMSTNASNQIFDWHRFTAALRKELVENKRQLLLILLAMFLGFTVFMVIGNLIASNMGERSANIMMEIMPAAFTASVYTFIVAITASLAFRNLTSKTGRISLFTSPSSNFEKFLVNLTIYVIGAAIAFFACAQLADLARIAVLTPFKSETMNVPGPMNFFSILIDSSYNLLNSQYVNALVERPSFYRAITIASLFIGPAIYFMGSVLWPRWAVVKSFACQQVINMVLNIFIFSIFGFLGGFINPSMISLNPNSLSNDMLSSLIDYTNISITISFIICTLCWVGAWFLFKRKDVVSLKWWS